MPEVAKANLDVTNVKERKKERTKVVVMVGRFLCEEAKFFNVLLSTEKLIKI